MEMQNKWKIDFWTFAFGILSLILFELAIIIPKERIIISGFLAISLITTLILYYINKINFNEKIMALIKEELTDIKNELTEKFNYLKEIYNLKAEIEMLKKRGKRAQINLELLFKILVAVILVYVIIQAIKTLSSG
jgi:sensor domain CHASE-containing protein